MVIKENAVLSLSNARQHFQLVSSRSGRDYCLHAVRNSRRQRSVIMPFPSVNHPYRKGTSLRISAGIYSDVMDRKDSIGTSGMPGTPRGECSVICERRNSAEHCNMSSAECGPGNVKCRGNCVYGANVGRRSHQMARNQVQEIY